MGTLLRPDEEAMARVSDPCRGLPPVGWGHGVEPFPGARRRVRRQRANDRTLGLWQELRGSRPFPTPDEATTLTAELRRKAGDLEAMTTAGDPGAQ